MKKILAASRTKRRNLDLMIGEAGAQKLPPVGLRKIEVRLRPLRSHVEKRGVGHGVQNVLAHFVTADANVRADRGDEIPRIDGKSLQQSCHCSFGNARRSSTPPGMNRCDGRAA